MDEQDFTLYGFRGPAGEDAVFAPPSAPAWQFPRRDAVKPAREPIRRCLGACVVTDAAHYTSVAEGMDPAATVELINRYLEALFRPVFENGGFVSDVKGDGILAVWAGGLPELELRGRVCRALLQMAESVESFNRSAPAHRLATRIGACFGPIALATVGALAHFEYRAVGDTVNTSSRLEQLNKRIGTRVLVSKALAEGLKEFLFRNLGKFKLRGKRTRIRVYELLGSRATASEAQRRLCSEFSEALQALQAGRLHEARARFRELCTLHPHDGPSHLQLRNCEALLAGSATRGRLVAH
jgi:adenylate cyclase